MTNTDHVPTTMSLGSKSRRSKVCKPLLPDTHFEDQTSPRVRTIEAIPRGRFWSSLVVTQGRFSSLRCGDSTLTHSSSPTELAWIEEWVPAP